MEYRIFSSFYGYRYKIVFLVDFVLCIPVEIIRHLFTLNNYNCLSFFLVEHWY